DGAAVAICLWIVVRELGAPRFDFPMGKLFRFYLPLEFANIVIYAQTWFDRALLVAFVPLATLGVYNAAVTAYAVLNNVSIALNNMIFPALSSIRNKSGTLQVSNAIRLATRYACFT